MGVWATSHLFFLEPFTPSSGLPDSSLVLVQTQLPGLRPQLSRLLRRGRRFLRNNTHSAVCPRLFPVSGTQASTASVLARVGNQPGLTVPVPKDILDFCFPSRQIFMRGVQSVKCLGIRVFTNRDQINIPLQEYVFRSLKTRHTQ